MMKRTNKGFTLLEVIIAFTISVMAFTAIYASLSFITKNIIEIKFGKKMKELSLINEIFILENLKKSSLKEITSEESISLPFRISKCERKMYKELDYTVCFIDSGSTYAKLKGWKFLYVKEIDLVLSPTH